MIVTHVLCFTNHPTSHLYEKFSVDLVKLFMMYLHVTLQLRKSLEAAHGDGVTKRGRPFGAKDTKKRVKRASPQV